MEINLTWNLVIIAAFVLLFSYNFMLGQTATIKLILSTYIAIFTSDGLAGLIERVIFEWSPGFEYFFADQKEEIFMWTRILFFLLAIVLFSVKSGFHIVLDRHDHWLVRLVLHGIFAVFSAILFLSTVMVFLAGSTFVEGMSVATNAIMYEKSILARAMIDYYQFWFSIPALLFLITSFFLEPEEK